VREEVGEGDGEAEAEDCVVREVVVHPVRVLLCHALYSLYSLYSLDSLSSLSSLSTVGTRATVRFLPRPLPQSIHRSSACSWLVPPCTRRA
jgi:hypothetical protein